jgi:hypothetical protein
MFDNQVDIKYKILIKYLLSNGYKLNEENNQKIYQKKDILIRIDSNYIVIKDNYNNRRYYFNLDTSNNFLINFLTFLNNNYSETLI